MNINEIKAAQKLLQGQIINTPSLYMESLSAKLETKLFLKLENMQHSSSFKVRGALVKIASLSPEEKARGIIAMSAGNHAQGVAFHAQRLNIPVTIVMPKNSPLIKIAKTEELGANVILEGETLSQAQEYTRKLIAEKNLVLIHPYDDPLVIAGQGTIAIEMLEANPDLDVIIVPVGGGGLISGIAIAAKAIKPSIKIIGVQSENFPAMAMLFQGNVPISRGKPSIAEGIAVKAPGIITARIIGEMVDEMLIVKEASIEKALLYLLEYGKIATEGAGAAPLAALLENPDKFKGLKVGLVISGGNIDARLMASLLLRGLAWEGRLTKLRIELPDSPGSLSQVTKIIGDNAGNILEVQHQRTFLDIPAKSAEIDVLVETSNASHFAAMQQALEKDGFNVQILGVNANI